MMNLGWITSGPGQLLIFGKMIALMISQSLGTILHRVSVGTRWGKSGDMP